MPKQVLKTKAQIPCPRCIGSTWDPQPTQAQPREACKYCYGHGFVEIEIEVELPAQPKPKTKPKPSTRSPSPMRDLYVLSRLTRHFRRLF